MPRQNSALAGPDGGGQGTLTAGLKAKAAAIRQSGEIALYGVIGDWWDGLDSASVISQIEALGDVKALTVHVNSPGGYVLEGLAIYNYLRDHAARVTIVVDSLSASIASLITMAGDEIVMQRGALMMIHNPWNMVVGDANEIRKAADLLDKMGTSMAGIYAERSGMDPTAVHAAMDAETWYSGAEAVAAGFATREAAQVASMDAAAVFDLSKFHAVPAVLSTARASHLQRSQPSMAGSAATPTITPQPLNASSKMKGTSMDEPDTTNTPTAAAPPPANDTGAPMPNNDGAAASASALAQARQMITDITAECRRHGLAQATVDTITAKAATVADARGMILDALATKDQQTPTRSGVSVGQSHDSPDAVRGAVVGALAHAMDPKIKIEGKAQSYRGYAPLALFEEWAAAASITIKSRSRDGLAQAALHSTSDFPLLLGEAANQVLLAAYEIANPTYRAIASLRNFADFRDHGFLRAGDFPELEQLTENGEIKAGSMSESKEKVALKTWGRKIGLTRQMLVNDSLGAFADFPTMVARRVAAQENAIAFGVLTANSGAGIKMQDGKFLFHADHANKAATGAEPSIASLGAARAGMRKQTSADGLKLNPAPKILLTSPDNETLAEQLTTAVTATAGGDVNPFQNKVVAISDAELSGTGWYLFGDPGLWPVLVYGYLNGQTGPVMRTREGWDTDGMEITVVHDFAAGAIGTVGGYYNPGS